MPVMNGPDAIKVIRSKHKSIPIILLTGFPDSELVPHALEFAPITLLSKPLKYDQIISCIKSYFPK